MYRYLMVLLTQTQLLNLAAAHGIRPRQLGFRQPLPDLATGDTAVWVDGGPDVACRLGVQATAGGY